MDYDFDLYEDKAYIERRNARRALEREKRRRKKLLIRRTTIVAVMLLIVVVVITLLVLGVKAIFGGGSKDNKTDETTAPTVAVSSANTNNNALVFNEPDVPDDKTDGYTSSANSGVYIYNKAAYELFAGSESSAQDYASCISEFKAQAGDKITVYNMIIPNHTEFGIPKRLIQEGKVQSNNQAENIKTIYSSYTEDVVPINCYNELSAHNSEYLYFNTDHHWTGLGGYYAYKAFCEQTNQKVLDLAVCTENQISGYEGSLMYCDGSLYENLDTVHFWTFPYSTYAMRTEGAGDEPYETTVYYEGATSGEYTYGAFIWGDCALFVEHNNELSNGKKIAVIKESYGNAFVPYLTANYEEVHVIDFRYFEENLKDYCTTNGIEEVMFVNNIVAANTAIQVDRIRTLFD